MYCYILVLLLINTSYQSLGAPTNPNATVPLGNLLTSLIDRCENAFLIDQIKSQLQFCSDFKGLHGEKQLRCLMFYDMNNQLCSAVGDAKLAITEDFAEKINLEQDVTSLCNLARGWTFTNITEFPKYKTLVDKVFTHPIYCGNICGAEDISSDDGNYYCKYYNWGFGMLKQTVGTQDVPPILPLEDKLPDTKPSAPVNIDFTDLQIKTSAPKEGVTSQTPSVDGEGPSGKNNDVVKTAQTSPITVKESLNPSAVISENDLAKNKVSAKPENPVKEEEKPETISMKSDAGTDNTAGESIPETLEDTQNKPEDTLKNGIDKEAQVLSNELEKKDNAVLENPKGKIPNDPEDYQDSDEGKDGLGDMQGGDDGEDPTLDDINNKPKVEQKESVKRIETVATYSERDYYANPARDGLTPDEDNFFPFFLTAIILVVLLYILYHNKSKLSKWFFGLVLEGRQSNRRRNSRGHAYKRLDTLEQAMSTGAAAPPTKIIY